MTTVNNLSGGKTSSYLGIHYPADHELFALVCIDCHNANGGFWRNDKKLLQTVRDKLNKTCPQYNEFVATAEDPTTVITMLDLEQKMGREITWVRGMGFDELITYKKALPNIAWRFCTEYMKIIPIFEYIYMNIGEVVDSRIGFRYDEKERADSLRSTISFPKQCSLQGARQQKWVHDYEYRKLSYPLIDDKIMRPMVNEFWDKNPDIIFPEDTGCQNCFWKDPQQIKLNYDRKSSHSIVEWANIVEQMEGSRFKKTISMESIRDIGIQMDFFGGTGPGCQAGICGI